MPPSEKAESMNGDAFARMNGVRPGRFEAWKLKKSWQVNTSPRARGQSKADSERNSALAAGRPSAIARLQAGMKMRIPDNPLNKVEVSFNTEKKLTRRFGE
jgi:hypothetical protein